MSLGDDVLQREPTENGKLLFCKNQIITAKQIAVLIIKPSNKITNANATAKNIDSIIGRLEKSGWVLQGVKLRRGGSANITRIITHYPQPFYDSQTEDVRPQLTDEERKNLEQIWGKAANSYPIYHPVQLANAGRLDYKTIADIWHAGRGEDNKLLDSGNPTGINTVTKTKNAEYGKRRLLLVKDHPDLPGAAPFFIVNGFSAELLVKFSRPGERIIAMAFSQKDSQHGLEYIREHVIGETKPHKARPGSIRYDALYAANYSGPFPVTSLDTVGIENNIVHLSDSVAEAYRELRLWLPEMMWFPPTGSFAPDISFQAWEDLRQRYLKRRLASEIADVANPKAGTLKKWSALTAPANPITTSVNVMAGGSGGRFFGYETPEHLRNKLFAPIVPIGKHHYSFLELQLARLSGKAFVKHINIFASENTAGTIQTKIDELAPHTSAARKTSVFTRRGVPRIAPAAEDLLADSKFQTYCAKRHIDAAKQAQALGYKAGKIVQSGGMVAAKPPGHLSVFLHYIHHCLKTDLERDVEVAFFHIGEDTAAAPDPRFLAHARTGNAIAYIGVVQEQTLQPGYLISASGKLQLHESSANIGVTAPFYINTCRIALNVPALAKFLADSTAAFLKLSEAEIRQKVTEKIMGRLTPRFEIKPINNYARWAGQFAYPIGQISEVLPTEFIRCDEPFPEILTFKTKKELHDILPVIKREYKPYLSYLPSQQG